MRKEKRKKALEEKPIPPPLFQGLALADSQSVEPETNISIPSDDAVAEAKEWTEEHKL